MMPLSAKSDHFSIKLPSWNILTCLTIPEHWMQGVYGLPKCLGEDHRLCDYARRLLNYGAYTSWIQRLLVQVRSLIVILMLHKQLLTIPRLSTGMTPWQRLSMLPSLCSSQTSTIRCSKSTSSDWSILLAHTLFWLVQYNCCPGPREERQLRHQPGRRGEVGAGPGVNMNMMIMMMIMMIMMMLSLPATPSWIPDRVSGLDGSQKRITRQCCPCRSVA